LVGLHPTWFALYQCIVCIDRFPSLLSTFPIFVGCGIAIVLFLCVFCGLFVHGHTRLFSFFADILVIGPYLFHPFLGVMECLWYYGYMGKSFSLPVLRKWGVVLGSGSIFIFASVMLQRVGPLNVLFLLWCRRWSILAKPWISFLGYCML
jgi:hypothetical protein